MRQSSSENGKIIHLIGFGSQARAWAQCLRASSWDVRIYLARPQGKSGEAARDLEFACAPLSGLENFLKSTLPLLKNSSEDIPLIAMLCPDSVIGGVYRDHLADFPAPLTVLLAHGYAVYAGDLRPANPAHELALLAPKAIGPKIWALYQQARPQFHRLVAGFHASATRSPAVQELARALGFAPENLAPASFKQEAIGDLLSEQGLLCGGVFTLLEWTMKAMKEAGVPAALIHEECLTELELIAGMLRELGPSATFSAISQAAQCGTVLMQERFERSGLRAEMEAQFKDVLDKKFVEDFRSDRWKPRAQALLMRLGELEK